jgi:hypothetical protein
VVNNFHGENKPVKQPDSEVQLKYVSRVFAYRTDLIAEASAADLSICNSVR